MDCHKLRSDIERLKSLRDELADKLEASTESGLGKIALSSLSHEASNSADTLLEEYAYDLVEQNIKDKSGRNTDFLNYILEQYYQEQDQSEPTINPETPNNPEALITEDTTIDEVRGDLAKYVKSDPKLDSNLLAYAVKERLGLSPINSSVLKSIEELYADSLPDQTLPKLAYLHKIAERLKNLEVLETENYIFMLPKDKWEQGKIKLPNPENNSKTPEYIAPSDLTAILKSPVYYDWSYETDRQSTDDPDLVYDEKWIGKEIRHFPWSKELIKEANEKLLKPNGYHIPTKDEFASIYDNLKFKLARKQNTTPDNITDEQISTALQEDLSLAFSGYVWKGDLDGVGRYGCFWSASVYSAYYAYCLGFGSDSVHPNNWDNRCGVNSVRCVS